MQKILLKHNEIVSSKNKTPAVLILRGYFLHQTWICIKRLLWHPYSGFDRKNIPTTTTLLSPITNFLQHSAPLKVLSFAKCFHAATEPRQHFKGCFFAATEHLVHFKGCFIAAGEPLVRFTGCFTPATGLREPFTGCFFVLMEPLECFTGCFLPSKKCGDKIFKNFFEALNFFFEKSISLHLQNFKN